MKLYSVTFDPGNTCIGFDPLQVHAPRSRAALMKALKYFAIDNPHEAVQAAKRPGGIQFKQIPDSALNEDQYIGVAD